MPLDIGVGILLALLIAHLYAVKATWTLVIFGVASALLPDVDMLLRPLRRSGIMKDLPERFEYNHRSVPHYPALYIPPVVLAYFFFGNTSNTIWTTLFAFCIAAHLIHDTIGLGWGISWLWPFSTRRFLSLPERSRRKSMGLFMTWTEAEEPALAARFHDPHWIRNFYLRPTVIGCIEYAVFFAAVTALYIYMR